MSIQVIQHAPVVHTKQVREAPAGGGARLRVEWVRRTAELIGLREPWDDLARRAGVEHPFVSHAWLLSWWQAFGHGKELRTLVVWRGDRCVGIAPLMLQRTSMYGVPLRLLSSPCNEQTPRFEFLVDPEVPSAWDVIWRHLQRMQLAWDALLLSHLPASCDTATHIDALAGRASMRRAFWDGSRSPRLEVAGTFDAHVTSLPPKLRQNMRRQARRLQDRGEVDLEQVTIDGAFGAAFADGLRLEAAGWKGDGDTAIACNRDLASFYDLLGERTSSLGWLVLQFLTVDGRRVAFSYGLRYEGGLFLMKLGFDPAFASYSPSAVLTHRIVEWAFEQKIRVVDVLGDEDGWKRQRMPSTLAHRWLYVFPDSLRGRFLHAAKFAVAPRLRSALARLEQRLPGR